MPTLSRTSMAGSILALPLLLLSSSVRAQPPPPGSAPSGYPGAAPPYAPPPYAPAPAPPYGPAPPYPAPYPVGPAYPGGYPPSGYPAGPAPGAVAPKRTSLELGVLYGVSVAYGAGLGIWVDTELGIDDPAVFMISPAVLGLAMPVGVYLLDRPDMPRGMPSAVAAGIAIGAGEGIGIASYQFVTANEADAWGFRGLARATAIGATAGAVGGLALGYYQEPSPKSSLLVSSSVLWGSAIGGFFGYGVSEAGVGYGLANDSASLGGLIGFNAGLVASAGLSIGFVPSYYQLSWMWAGAGIGAVASLPVFLFYAGDEGPPAKRGFVFTGTATLLGIAGGALLTWGDDDTAQRGTRDLAADDPPWVNVAFAGPALVGGAPGFQIGGQLR